MQEETLSYVCDAGAPAHRIELPPHAREGDKSMQWVLGEESIATYPPSGPHPLVLGVGAWGIDLARCLNLTLLVFDTTGKERRLHYRAVASPGSLPARTKGTGQRSDCSGAWRLHAANSGGFGVGLLLSLLITYLLF